MSSLELEADLAVFKGLKSYSRTDVELINCFNDLFRTDAHWELWIREGLGALLETPSERVVVLLQSSHIEPGQSQRLSFQKDAITIGREPDNDVVLPFAGVGRQHARITNEGGRYSLEDLGSANGTYLGDVKLEPRKHVFLEEGAEFLIFPHQFSFSTREVRTQQAPLRLSGGPPRVVVSSQGWLHELGGTRLFCIKVSPDIGSAILMLSQELFVSLTHGMTRVKADRAVPDDNGLFEFLLLSVLERANRELRFPFYFSLIPFAASPKREPGVSIECVADVTGITGVMKIFLPSSLLRMIHHPTGDSESLRIPVSWSLLETMGYADLSLQELAELEAGDILLIASAHLLLLPVTTQGGERGWEAQVLESDPRRLSIGDYFERSNFTMESEAAIPEQSDFQKPNLAILPVRVHIVLSQLEMSLAELKKLRPGSVVELNHEKPEAVQLAVNGKIAGAGELVEIEGRLGVRISNWNAQ